MDYIAYDRAHHRVWVPAGNTGSVDVVDVKDDQVTRVEGLEGRPEPQCEAEGPRGLAIDPRLNFLVVTARPSH
jgi:DNA-binding beta-propeller fold protein YncE